MYGESSPFRSWLVNVSTVSALICALSAQALPPGWWSQSGPDGPPVISAAAANNHGLANVGQGKWVALNALRALEQHLGTSSPEAIAVRSELLKSSELAQQGVFYPERPENPSPEWIAKQHAPLQIGALKALAAPFYKALSGPHRAWLAGQLGQNGLIEGDGENGYFESSEGYLFPWNPADDTDSAKNRSVANIGQLKLVFSLRFEELQPDPDSDADGDGLTLSQELAIGTDPNKKDTDGDGMPDGWELEWELDPLLFADGDGDLDHDGVPNAREFQLGTGPTGTFRLETIALDSQTSEYLYGAGEEGSVILQRQGDVKDLGGAVIGAGWTNDLVGPPVATGSRTRESLPLGDWESGGSTPESATTLFQVAGDSRANFQHSFRETDGIGTIDDDFVIGTYNGISSSVTSRSWSVICGDLYEDGFISSPVQPVPDSILVGPLGESVAVTAEGEVFVLGSAGTCIGQLPLADPANQFTSIGWHAINDSGSAVGLAQPGNVPVSWSGGFIHDESGYLLPLPVPAEWNNDQISFHSQLSNFGETVIRRSDGSFHLLDIWGGYRPFSLPKSVEPGGATVAQLNDLGGIVGNGSSPWIYEGETPLSILSLHVSDEAGSSSKFGSLGWSGVVVAGLSKDRIITGEGLDPQGQKRVFQLVPVLDQDGDGVADDYERAVADWLNDEFSLAVPTSPAQFDVDADYASLGLTTRQKAQRNDTAPTRLGEGEWRGYRKTSALVEFGLMTKTHDPEFYYRKCEYDYHYDFDNSRSEPPEEGEEPEEEEPEEEDQFPKITSEINHSETVEFEESQLGDDDVPTYGSLLFWKKNYKNVSGDYTQTYIINPESQTAIEKTKSDGQYSVADPDDDDPDFRATYDITIVDTRKNGEQLPPRTRTEIVDYGDSSSIDLDAVLEGPAGGDTETYKLVDDEGVTQTLETWKLSEKISWRELAKKAMGKIEGRGLDSGYDSNEVIIGGYGGNIHPNGNWQRSPEAVYQSARWTFRAGESPMLFKLVKREMKEPPAGTKEVPFEWEESSEIIAIAPRTSFELERDTVPDEGVDIVFYYLQPLYVSARLVPVSESGELLSQQQVPLPTLSGPKVSATVGISGLSVDQTGNIHANFAIGGGLTSKPCSMVAAPVGQINTVDLIVNGAMAGSYGVQAYKTTASGPYRYPFHAAVNFTAGGIKVADGINRIAIQAKDPVTGIVGSHEFAFTVNVSATVDTTGELTNVSATATQPVAVSQSGEGETFPYYIEILGLDHLTAAQLADCSFGMEQTDSREVLMADPATKRVFVADPNMPGEALGVMLRPSLGDEVTDQQAEASWTKADVVKMLSESFGAAVQFQEGFRHGVWDGGVELVKGTGETVVGAADYLENGWGVFGSLVNVGFATVLGTADDVDAAWSDFDYFEGELRPANEQIYQLGEFGQKLVSEYVDIQSDLFLAIFGDPLGLDEAADDARVRLSNTQQMTLIICYELFDIAREELGNASPYDLGKICGRIFFEVASLAIPAGGQAAAVTKANVLRKLASQGKLLNAARGSDEAAVMGRIVQRIAALATEFETTKMCFPAGTAVATEKGLVAIEQIRPGDLVWSKSDFDTGVAELKPVLQTFTTVPESLFVLSYDVDGDMLADGEVEATDNHPFWVEERHEFVPLEELRAGATLRLKNGSATVVEVLENQGGGARQTYNLEVKDFHTYYVAGHGIWVHNKGFPCERALSIFNRFRKQAGAGKVWDPFKDTMRNLDRVKQPEILSQKVFNEARRKWFDEGLAEIPPWRNTGGVNQLLHYAPDGTPLADSGRLATNMERAFGYKKIPYSEAHHIIPKAEAGAAELRDMLRRFGVHPDDASNGTFMIRQRTRNQYDDPSWLDGLGPNHQNHGGNSAYLAKLNEDLDRFKQIAEPTAEDIDDLKDALQTIARKLSDSDYPWP